MTAGRDTAELLPDGWHALAPDHAAALVARLTWEISKDHALAGVAVEAVAVRGGNDDVLFRHLEQGWRLTVVHLTWSSRPETTPHFPSVEFDGTFAEFLESERLLGAERNS
jgi:hypothetical protein